MNSATTETPQLRRTFDVWCHVVERYTFNARPIKPEYGPLVQKVLRRYLNRMQRIANNQVSVART
jgi:hypothetical protein